MTAKERSLLLVVFLITGLAYGLWAPRHHWWLWLTTWIGAWVLTLLVVWIWSRQRGAPSSPADQSPQGEWLHEIRTPLTHVGLYLHQLRSVVPDTSQDAVDALQAELERVHGLLESLSVLSASGAARDAEPLRLNAWLTPALSLYRDVALTLGHALVTDIQPAPPIRAHEADLRQILANILSNAFRYAIPESPVTVTLGPDGPLWVHLTVSNPSPAILGDPDALLLPFVHGSDEGSGLGLAVVNRLMHSMHGRVHLTYRGGEFSIRLLWPRVQEKDTPM
jgi:signal transduction histidine kinase